ncbi:hypothetical protein AAMO2058_001638200 [Amorphochlora amoebiformis]
MASVSVAYLLWLIGGYLGLHHLYLGRPNHALLWLISGGGFGIGLIRDFFTMHDYTNNANIPFEPPADPLDKPRGSWSKFIGAYIFAGYLRALCASAVPEELEMGEGFMVIPHAIGVALGVYLVGNNGKEGGPFLPTMLASLLCEFLRTFLLEEWGALLTLVPIYTFARYRVWVPFGLTPQTEKRRCWTSLFKHFLKGSFFLVLVLSFIYHNATITIEVNGHDETRKVKDQIIHIWRSPAVQEFFTVMGQVWVHVQHHGFQSFWDELVKNMDLDGEEHAYKVLGLEKGATDREIKRKYRSLARKYHPDKCFEPECEGIFREIQEAYENLKNVRSRESRRSHDDL